jgi:hypothetical protein
VLVIDHFWGEIVSEYPRMSLVRRATYYKGCIKSSVDRFTSVYSVVLL